MLKNSTLLYIAIAILALILIMLFFMYITRDKKQKYEIDEDEIDNFEIYNKIQDLSDNLRRLENKLKFE